MHLFEAQTWNEMSFCGSYETARKVKQEQKFSQAAYLLGGLPYAGDGMNQLGCESCRGGLVILLIRNGPALVLAHHGRPRPRPPSPLALFDC